MITAGLLSNAEKLLLTLSFRAKRGISEVRYVQSEIPRFARNDTPDGFFGILLK
jgi:hypothetical protein